MAAILVVKNMAAHYAVYVLNGMWHVNVTIRQGFMYTSAYALYTQMLLCWHPHSEMEVWSGTTFIWDSSCCLQWKCVGMPGRATWNIGWWSCCTVLCNCKVGTGMQVQHVNVLCVSDYNRTVCGGRQALYSELNSW